jgi:hypothetical protein
VEIVKMNPRLTLIPGVVAPAVDVVGQDFRPGVYIDPVNLQASDLFREGDRSHTLVFGPTRLGGTGLWSALNQTMADRGIRSVETDRGACVAIHVAARQTARDTE